MSHIIETLDNCVRDHQDAIDAWFAARAAEKPPLFYNSVDLRHSGVKLAPVDTNVYPAGFNNLSRRSFARGVERMQAVLGDAKRVLIIPENHTRNLGYLDNLYTLQAMAEAAGKEVRIGSLVAAPGEMLSLPTLSGKLVKELPLKRAGNVIETEDGFRADVILVNNDLTTGVPSLLEGLTQAIVPPLALGWYQRKKSVHFAAYDALVQDFCRACGMDPWLITTVFHQCGRIDFRERVGLECLAKGVDSVLAAVQKKYDEYGIKDEPYVFIKADSGTYGMGIMTARSGEELLDINKKTRNKMNVIKEGAHNTEVMIQEAVPTIDAVNGNTAEPVIYLIGGEPIGGAYRVNAERDARSNLNAQGMSFTGMCDEEESDGAKVQVKHCNYDVFSLIAKLAAYAAAREEYAAVQNKQAAGA